MLKTALVGAGHLGKIHLKLLKDITQFELVGFFDSDPQIAQKVAKELDIPLFDSFPNLLQNADVLSIITPTDSHFEYAKAAIENGCHFFVEKPITETPQQALQLMEMCKKHDILAQVGHVERFNPAFWSIKDKITNPVFIETHRLAQFSPRGTEVSVVLDLMIHDLDIILSVVKAKLIDIQASGVALLTDKPDIVNARLSFENGCVANVTASRISMKKMRKMRLFQKNAYVSIDFLERKSDLVHLSDQAPTDLSSIELANKFISFDSPVIEDHNAIELELQCFAQSILHQKPIEVDLEDGFRALDLACKINEIVEKNISTYQKQ